MSRKPSQEECYFARGVCVACGIIQSCFDAPIHCAEAMVACGIETAPQARRYGVDEYDIELLRPVFAEIKMHKPKRVKKPK